jgi:hypothetical protein
MQLLPIPKEHEFRAYDPHKKFMLYLYDQKVAEVYDMLPGEFLSTKICQIGIINNSLMPYLGRCDSKGNKVYVDDIIQAYAHHPYRTDNNYYVSYDPKRCCYIAINCTFLNETTHYPLERILDEGGKVIGNLWESEAILQECDKLRELVRRF